MKKIIVPFDFSALSLNALRFALDIAEASKGEVIALHVVDLSPAYLESFDPNGYTGSSASVLTELGREATIRFESVKKELKYSFQPIFRLEKGLLHQVVIKAIHETEADLVVMGTKGSSGLTELLIGSDTEKIVRNAPVPVITVHKAQRLEKIRNIIFPTVIDLDQHRFMWQVKALQTFFGAHLHLLYVKTPDCKDSDKSLSAMLENFAAAYELSNFSVHVTHAPSEDKGVLKFSARIGDSMIAMGTHGYTGLTHLMLGSIAENVVNHTHEAVWTYRIPEHA